MRLPEDCCKPSDGGFQFTHSPQRCFHSTRAGPPLGGSKSPRLFSARRLAQPAETCTTRILSLSSRVLSRASCSSLAVSTVRAAQIECIRGTALNSRQFLVELGAAMMGEHLANK